MRAEDTIKASRLLKQRDDLIAFFNNGATQFYLRADNTGYTSDPEVFIAQRIAKEAVQKHLDGVEKILTGMGVDFSEQKKEISVLGDEVGFEHEPRR